MKSRNLANRATSGFSRHVPRYNPEHGEPGRHPLELGERRILVDRQMRSGNGCSLQVCLQHGRAGNDDVAGFYSNDTLSGDSGADDLNASWGNDLVHGGDGPDKIVGDTGVDQLYGDDTIEATETNPTNSPDDYDAPDFVSCGGGIDTVEAEPVDETDADCEKIIPILLAG